MAIFGEMDSLFNLVSRFRRRSHVALPVKRFKQLIKEHDFTFAEFASLLPDWMEQPLSAFRSDEAIEKLLTDGFLDWTADQFGVRKKWLQGADDAVYDSILYGYKNIDGFFETMDSMDLLNPYTTMFVFTSGSLTENSCARLWVALEVPFAPKDEKDEHVRYIPLSDQWVWEHPPAHDHLIYIAQQFVERGGHSAPVYQVPAMTMERMHRRELIPNIRHLRFCKFAGFTPNTKPPNLRSFATNRCRNVEADVPQKEGLI